MSFQPDDRFFKRIGTRAVGMGWSIHHDYWYAHLARGQQFGVCGCASGILGDKNRNLFCLEQVSFVVEGEGAACMDKFCMRRQSFGVRRVDRANKVAVLRSSHERSDRQSANREEDVLRSRANCVGGSIGSCNARPMIVGRRVPWRSRKGEPRNIQMSTGFKRMTGHNGGERVRCVNHRRDAFLHEIVAKTVNSSEPANAMWNCWGDRRIGAARQRDNGVDCRLSGQILSERRGLRCAAKDQQTGFFWLLRQILPSNPGVRS